MKDQPVVLVVDDQPQNIELLEAYLVPQGYEIVKAVNGEEALEKLSGNQIDLILLDVMMPGMDGFEVTRRVRQDNTQRLLPIILVTALRETGDRVKGIEAGCDDFISKPIDKMELLARVRSLLKVKAYNDLLGNYRKELESEVTKRTEELKCALEMIKAASLETIYRLSMASEYRDKDTGAHIKRMSRYCAAVARRMGLDEHTIETILYAAPMHDLGKIGIPDLILVKPTKLDPAEWKIMKQHTVIGAKILEGSDAEFIRLGETIAQQWVTPRLGLACLKDVDSLFPAIFREKDCRPDLPEMFLRIPLAAIQASNYRHIHKGYAKQFHEIQGQWVG